MPGAREQDDERRLPGHREPMLFGRAESSRVVSDQDDDGEILLDEPAEDEEQPGRRRRLLPTLLALVALAAFGAVAWYAYNWGIGAVAPEELPVIRAEPGPEKIRPESPGGMEVPHQDKMVLNQISPDPNKPQVERLLPPPETPKPPTALGEAPSGQPAPTGQGESPSTTGEPTAASSAPESATGEAEPAISDIAPKTDAAAAATRPKAEAAPAVPQPDSEPTAESPTSAETPRAQTAAVPGGDAFVVQLASLKDRARVDQEWARLQKAHPDLLGDRQLAVQAVDLGSRGTYYRMQAGFFADRAAADGVCAKLKAKKQDCIVVRR